MRVLASLSCHLQYAIIIMLTGTAVALFSKWSNTGPVAGVQRSGKRSQLTNNNKGAAQKLIDIASTWIKKSQTDKNPVAALINTSYAVAYLDAASRVDTASGAHQAIEAQTAKLVQRQRAAVNHIHVYCPHVV